MQNTWMVVLPPLLVILFAHYTHSIITSLLVGIFSASLIIHDFSLIKSLITSGTKVLGILNLEAINSWESFWASNYLFLCLFLLILGIIIALLQYSGGVSAYGNFVKRYLKKAWHAELATLLLSLSLFVDDYFSCLTTGSVMRTVTDRFKIPRVKLALLVNTAAAPLAVLFPISSWVAEIIGQMQRTGITINNTTSGNNTSATLITGDPFNVYLGMTPFFFYCWISIIFLWVMVFRRTSYGTLKKQEQIAHETGNLFGGKNPVGHHDHDLSQDRNEQHSLVDFLVPMGMLFTSVFVSMLYFGNYHLFGGTQGIIQSLQKTLMAASLFIGSITTLLFSIVFLITRNKIVIRKIPAIFIKGLQLMGPSVTMLVLVWTLTALLNRELSTGSYIATFLGDSLSIHLLPLIFFLVTSAIGTFMGSGWGAMDILISIALPMTISLLHFQTPVALESITIIYPILGAIVSGAVVSHHLSPISDCMLMTSISAGAHHHDTVKVQSQFTIPIVFSASLAFLCAGMLIGRVSLSMNGLISMLVGIITQIIMLKILTRKKA